MSGSGSRTDPPGAAPDGPAAGTAGGWATGLRAPDLMPVLGRGRHRTPRQGGCFMEVASLLAGERWSDHPACTHPLLAALARAVNDRTGDVARPALVPLVPSVIGVVGGGPDVDVRLALLCATAALPVAAADRQRVLAVAVRTLVRVLDGLGADPSGAAARSAQEALASAPHAAAWAARVAGPRAPSSRTAQRRVAPLVVEHSVESIAGACVLDPDAVLRELLSTAVEQCRSWVAAAGPPVAAGAERRGARAVVPAVHRRLVPQQR